MQDFCRRQINVSKIVKRYAKIIRNFHHVVIMLMFVIATSPAAMLAVLGIVIVAVIGSILNTVV